MIFWSVLIATAIGHGKPAPFPKGLQEVQKKYATASSVTMKVKKIVRIVVLDKDKKAEGEIHLAPGGNFRLDIKEPTKSKIIMNGKDIWVVDYPTGDFKDDKIQVLHTKFKNQLKSQVILGFLVGNKNLAKYFTVTKETKDGSQTTFVLKAKETSGDLKEISLTVNPEEQTIEKVSYVDQLDNTTTYSFSDTKFDETVKRGIFTFKPPKDSEVAELH